MAPEQPGQGTGHLPASSEDTASHTSETSQATTGEEEPARHDTRHPVDQPVPAGRSIAGAIQHVAAMYAGVAAPPLIVGAFLNLSPTELSFLVGASLFTAGIATLLQTLGVWKIGARLPFVNGVSFATVAPMIAIAKSHDGDALPYLFGATIICGLVCFVAAPWFCKFIRFFPPVVSGTVITLIGISLVPVAANWSQGGDDKAADYGSLSNVGLAAITLLVVLVLRKLLRGFLQQIAILLGLLIGTLVAIPMGKSDFSSLADSPIVGFPTPFHFGAPQFDIAAIVSMMVVMLVAMTESTADMLALGEIVDKPAGERTIANGLRADGLSTALSPFFNGFMCSAFAQNIGLVALTKMRSRFVVAVGGVVLLVLGLVPVLGSAVALVPQPVLGGAGIVLFGTVAASGLKTLGQADMSKDTNLLIVATSIALGVLPEVAPDFYKNFPDSVSTVLDSGISTGCVAAVLLNLLFHHLHWGKKKDADADGDGAENTGHAAGADETSVGVPEQNSGSQATSPAAV